MIKAVAVHPAPSWADWQMIIKGVAPMVVAVCVFVVGLAVPFGAQNMLVTMIALHEPGVYAAMVGVMFVSCTVMAGLSLIAYAPIIGRAFYWWLRGANYCACAWFVVALRKTCCIMCSIQKQT